MQFMTVAQAAKEAEVHEATIRRWIGDGLLKSAKIGPGMIAILPADLERMLEDRKDWANGQVRGHSWFNTPINARKKKAPVTVSKKDEVHALADALMQQRIEHIRQRFPNPVPPGTVKEYCLNHLMSKNGG